MLNAKCPLIPVLKLTFFVLFDLFSVKFKISRVCVLVKGADDEDKLEAWLGDGGTCVYVRLKPKPKGMPNNDGEDGVVSLC